MNLNNFPVLISITDGDLATSAQDNGNDIVFTVKANNARYDHEIEFFFTSTGELEVWVRIPSLSGSTNTEISMWYGNSDCGAQENPTGVWDSSYKMVQHLAETSGACDDSTANNNNGTQHGGVTSTATGQINGADSFDGSNGYVSVPTDSSLEITGPITLAAWVNFNSLGSSSDFSGIVAKWNYYGSGWGYGLVKAENTDRIAFIAASKKTSGIVDAHSNSQPSLDTWYPVVGTYDGTTMLLYLNSVAQTDSGSQTWIYDNDEPVTIGSFEGTAWWFDGTIDEVRISNTARNAHWIQTSYNNLKTPSTFFSVGSQGGTGRVDPVPELPTLILFSVGLVGSACEICVAAEATWLNLFFA